MPRLKAALEDRYAIERELGEGGMATVYLARDVKHNRHVALKVLKPELAAVVGAERFLAEIETTAKLQHPNILPLFDSGEADSFLYYVMPYVEGETLRDRLEREKQLPVEDAVRIASELAQALDHAHRQGIIHRDVKPANVLLRDGRPLIADFGIALALGSARGRLTETGLSVGTPYYMSPEQAAGDREVGATSDIYALGCVLYEMLVGDPPHVGSTAQAVLANILVDEPEAPSSRRASIPVHVDAAIRRSLEKVAADRFTTGQSFADALSDPGFRHGVEASVGTSAGPWRRIAGGLGATSVLLALALGWAWSRPQVGSVYRVDLDTGALPSGVKFDVAVSPDGSTVAVAAGPFGQSAIFVRGFDESEFRLLPGTEGSMSLTFSPDGTQIVFDQPATGRLLRTDLAGETPVELVGSSDQARYHPSWGDDGTILFMSGSLSLAAVGSGEASLYQISEAGGAPMLLADSVRGSRPTRLPDGSILMSGGGGTRVIKADGETLHTLSDLPGHALYARSGHMFEVDARGSLFATRYDLRRHERTGPRVPLVRGLAVTPWGSAFFVSETGTLVALRGPGFLDVRSTNTALKIIDRVSGAVQTTDLPTGTRFSPQFSPDGGSIAYTEADLATGSQAVWTLDLLTKEARQLTFAAEVGVNVRWSPDGETLVFAATGPQSDGVDLYSVSANAPGSESILLSLPGDQFPQQWLADDRILFKEDEAPTAPLYYVDSAGGSPERYAEDEEPSSVERPGGSGNSGGAVSPDGSSVAVVSIQSGVPQLFVRAFPTAEGRTLVSETGGFNPRWSSDGDTLFYWVRGGQNADSLKAVTIDRSDGVVVRDRRGVYVAEYRGWDLHPDGRQIIVSDVGPDVVPERMVVVVNLFEEIKRLSGSSVSRR